MVDPETECHHGEHSEADKLSVWTVDVLKVSTMMAPARSRELLYPAMMYGESAVSAHATRVTMPLW